MNRFAELVASLETLADDQMRNTWTQDYLSQTSEPDRTIAERILRGEQKLRPIKLALLRGLATERIDPALLNMAEFYTGDAGEAIALTWTPNRRANRDPSLSEIIESFSTLGKSELPKRIEAWLDACDETGRWALIKLITGTLRSGRASASKGDTQQNELFQRPTRKSTAGSIKAILLYAERTNPRTRTSPLRCTIGVWNGEALAPIGQVDAGAHLALIEDYVAANTTGRFGPVREVRRDHDQALVLDIAFAEVVLTAKRKAGLTLRAPKIVSIDREAAPASVATLAQLLATATSADH